MAEHSERRAGDASGGGAPGRRHATVPEDAEPGVPLMAGKDRPTMQKARAGQSVSDEELARYTAARAFLFGEWAGAVLMVASFTQLYVFLFGPLAASTGVVVGVGAGLLALGAWMFWTNRTYYHRLDWPFRRRWELAATVVAGSGLLFWLMFLVLLLLTVLGKPVLPT